MLKRNPKNYSEKPSKDNFKTSETIPEENPLEEKPFEPIYYDLDDLLKDVTPDQMQEEISTGPAVGNEIF